MCLLMPPSRVECLLTSVPRGLCPVASPHHLCLLHLPQGPRMLCAGQEGTVMMMSSSLFLLMPHAPLLGKLPSRF